MRNIIVGGGPAGYQAAKTLRAAGEEVVLVNMENEPYYSRVLISHYLGDLKPRENVYLEGTDVFEKMGVETRLGKEVVKVEPNIKRVTLNDGEVLSYDNLLVASGSKPVTPPIPGKELPGVFTLYTLEDADAIKKWVRPGEPAVVIGGGLVAIKALEGLLEMHLPVSLIEIMDQILPAMVDADAAVMLQDALLDHGVNLYLKNTVAAIEGKDKVEAVRLQDGTVVPCHLVIMGTGVKPAAKFLEGTGVEINHGIVVDEYLQTSVPGIYAAGDVAEGYDAIFGVKRVNALWPVAAYQGRIAAMNMAGQITPYKGHAAMNTVELMGMRVVSFGQIRTEAGYRESVLSLPEKQYYRKLVYQGKYIKGGVFINNIEGAGIIYWLARMGYPVEDIAAFNESASSRYSYIKGLNKAMAANA